MLIRNAKHGKHEPWWKSDKIRPCPSKKCMTCRYAYKCDQTFIYCNYSTIAGHLKEMPSIRVNEDGSTECMLYERRIGNGRDKTGHENDKFFT